MSVGVTRSKNWRKLWLGGLIALGGFTIGAILDNKELMALIQERLAEAGVNLVD